MGTRVEGRREMDFPHPTPGGGGRGESDTPGALSSLPQLLTLPRLVVQLLGEWWILGPVREGCAASSLGLPLQTFRSPCTPLLPAFPPEPCSQWARKRFGS